MMRGERGWAMATTMSFLAILMLVGFTSLGVADFQSKQTRKQRERESALALAEGVMTAQTFALARHWPGVNRASYPATCTSSTQTTGQCPNRQTLAEANSSTPTAAAFRGVDFLTGVTWTTKVRDNYGVLANNYSIASADQALTGTLGTCPAPCTRDFNDDKAMWVQARAVVKGQPRNVVALMKMEQLSEAVPITGLTSGALKITTNTNSALIDAAGSVVTVRCVPDFNLNNQALCTDFRGHQISPRPTQTNPGPVMNPDQIERFKERAIIDGTYYDASVGCPPSLVGQVVFIERCVDPPNYGSTWATACTAPAGLSQRCLNTIHKPGVLIVRCGALRLTDTWTYVGLIYFVNGSDGKCAASDIRGSNPPACPANGLDSRTVLDTQGGFGVWGAIATDGNACVMFESRSLSMKFDVRAFSALASYGTVGLVQNTWRELPATVLPTGGTGPTGPTW